MRHLQYFLSLIATSKKKKRNFKKCCFHKIIIFCLPQTEEEFLEGLTQGFPDDPVDREEEDEEEDEEEESEEEEEEYEEREKENSLNGERSRQNVPSQLESRADVVSMVFALQQEGETAIKKMFILKL